MFSEELGHLIKIALTAAIRLAVLRVAVAYEKMCVDVFCVGMNGEQHLIPFRVRVHLRKLPCDPIRGSIRNFIIGVKRNSYLVRENVLVLSRFQAVYLTRNKHIIREVVPIAPERHIEVRRGLYNAVFDLIAVSSKHIVRGIFKLPDRAAGRVIHIHVPERHSSSSEIICALTSGASRK